MSVCYRNRLGTASPPASLETGPRRPSGRCLAASAAERGTFDLTGQRKEGSNGRREKGKTWSQRHPPSDHVWTWAQLCPVSDQLITTQLICVWIITLWTGRGGARALSGRWGDVS